MELDQLRYAIAVADHGSFGRAAASLGLTQPAVSMAISKLEAEFGVELFFRRGHGSVPTVTGEAVLSVARRTIREVENLYATARGESNDSQRLYVAMTSVFVPFVAQVATQLRCSHPHLDLALEVHDGVDAVAELDAGRFDVAVSRITALPRSLVAVELGDNEYFAAFPYGHAPANTTSISMQELAQHQLIAPRMGSATRALFDQKFHDVGLEPKVVIEVTSPEAMIELVRAGAGVAIASCFGVLSTPLSGSVVLIPFRPRRSARFGLHFRSNPSPAVEIFETTAKQVAQHIVLNNAGLAVGPRNVRQPGCG